MIRRGWDALATWRDARMGEDGDLWHRAIIDPTLLRVVGPIRGLDILDLACGNGYLTRRWARAGAHRCLGVEQSRPTIALARARERRRPTGAEFLQRDAARLSGLASSSFDLVVANMAIQDIRDAAGTFREVARVLRTGGRLVCSLSHPCFDLDERSEWLVEQLQGANGRSRDVVWRKVRAYREERSLLVPWRISEKESGLTTSYHRTLSTYSRLLRAAGFAITRLEEPLPLAEGVRTSPQGSYMLEIPLHLVIEARQFSPRKATLAQSPRTPANSRSAKGGTRP